MAARRRDVVIRAEPAHAEARVLQPTIWLAYSFAPEWFRDALCEAQTGHDHHSRRREILFAVCFAESYLFEWVRDEVLKGDYDGLLEYFPVPHKRRGVRRRWKEVLKQLLENGKIGKEPDLGGRHEQEWKRLVDYRDGLVHARASRPQTTARPNERMPVPSKTDLDRLAAGWAVRVVIERVRLLHEAVNTPVPEWLVEP
jgi:hypothetical protein